jgi:hypothetical protein
LGFLFLLQKDLTSSSFVYLRDSPCEHMNRATSCNTLPGLDCLPRIHFFWMANFRYLSSETGIIRGSDTPCRNLPDRLRVPVNDATELCFAGRIQCAEVLNCISSASICNSRVLTSRFCTTTTYHHNRLSQPTTTTDYHILPLRPTTTTITILATILILELKTLSDKPAHQKTSNAIA